MSDNNSSHFLNRQVNWKDKFFYKKSDVLYQLTFAFCERFIAKHGDRTRDQMIQAARSGKQNVVEGLADGVTSTEMMIKLLNVARASLAELCQDFEDYAKAHAVVLWDKKHPRFDHLVKFCRHNNELEGYQPFFDSWTDEEYCNVGFTLCRMVDKMLYTYINAIEQDFVANGGIKEKMHRARTNYRAGQDEELSRLRQEVPLLREENGRLKAEIQRLQGILKDNGIEF